MKILETESVTSALRRHTYRVKEAELELIAVKQRLKAGDVSLEVLSAHDKAVENRIRAICDGIPQQRSLRVGSLRFPLPPTYLARA